MQYKIYKNIYETVEKKLNRIAKKAIKYNSDFTFKIVDEGVEEDKRQIKLNGYSVYCPYYIIEVNGTVKISDYEVVAVLEVHSNGNLIRRINKDIYIPDRFLTSDNVCEHCGCKRNRKELYIVHNEKTNEYKQVGSDCLALYTGLDANWITSYYDCLKELESNEYNPYSGAYVFDVKDVIVRSIVIINKLGYYSSNCDLPTKNLVYKFFTNNNIHGAISDINTELMNYRFYQTYFEAKDFVKDEVKELADKIIEYYLSLKPDTEFIHNIQVILKDGYCEFKHFGFLCYLPEGYNRYLKKETVKAIRDKKFEMSDYFGEVSKRYKNKEVDSVSKVTSWVTEYGETYLYMITLKEGNILMWKSSNWYSEEEMLNISKINFTVKGHKEYNGTKQTDVTRCKLIKEVKEENVANVQCNATDEALNMFFKSVEA